MQESLFGLELPPGFRYRDDFITVDEEAMLGDNIRHVEFSTFTLRGIAARRRVAFFGSSYEGDLPTSPMPDFLFPLRDKVAEWAGVDAVAFEMALLNEYPPGAPIGWHRDAPQYDIVAGVSLLSACRMKLRPYVPPYAQAKAKGPRRTATHEILLQRRSAYVLAGVARNGYEHHIPAVTTLRYSITFRTMRQ